MSILDNFCRARVVVIGDIMLDRFWWGSVERISPEAPVPVVRIEKMSLAAGGAANVAANIAGLDAEPVLIGAVGTDDEARQVADVLGKNGISPDHLIKLGDRPTTVKTRLVAHSQQVARIDQEDNSPIDENSENAVIRSCEKHIPNANVVVISDYAKGLLTERVIAAAIAAANNNRIPVLVDPKGRVYSKYAGATLLTPNRREAAEACNLDEGLSDAVAVAGKQLLSSLDVRGVLITQGADGMTLFRREAEDLHLSALARQVFDVTGAGDTVIATLATAVGAGASLDEAADLANIAAGLAVEQAGTTIVTLAELRPHLKNRTGQENY